jgi:hypothetical protein
VNTLRDKIDVSHLVVVDAPLSGTAVFDRLRSDPRVWHFASHGARDVAEMLGLADALGGHEAGLFEPIEREVHLAGVQRLRQRAERELKPRAQLLAVRRLRGQQREQDLLDHPQLLAARSFRDRHADSL